MRNVNKDASKFDTLSMVLDMDVLLTVPTSRS